MSPPCSRFAPSASALAAQPGGRTIERLIRCESVHRRAWPRSRSGSGAWTRCRSPADHQSEFRSRGSRTPLCRAGRQRYPGSRSGARERAGREPGSAFGGLEPQSGARRARHSRARFHRGRTFTPEDVRNPANLDRLIDMVRRCHRDIPQYLARACLPCSGCSMSCATTGTRCAKATAATLPFLDDLLARAARLEAAVGPIDVVFGHNDLLAANLHR